jgi:large subunit ribosomal protein L21
MEAYAVVETGGKQYRVKQSDVLQVERLDAEVGSTVQMTPVLAVSDGKRLEIGTPAVPNATVTSTVVGHSLGSKVVSFKKKRRKGYSRKQGHRQRVTTVRVESIELPGA